MKQNTNLELSPAARQYRLAARGAASALIRQNECISLRYMLNDRPVLLTWRTRYLNLGFSAPVAGDMWLDAQGEEAAIDMAAARFVNVGRTITEIISLAANAAISHLDPEVVHEITPNQSRREYLQRFVESDRPALTSRFIDVNATSALIEAVGTSEERSRLLRAISHYGEALRSWSMGNEVRTMSHLFMGIEAIKTACWRSEIKSRQISKETLAQEWGFDPNAHRTLNDFIDSEARLKLIFKENHEAYKQAKWVSDAFEHGFENFHSLYQPAGRSLIRTAAYLREAIVKVSGVSNGPRDAILGERYNLPRGPGGLESYLRGYLLGDSSETSKSGTAHPYCRWESRLKDVTFNAPADKYSFHPSHTFTPSLAEGIQLSELKIEIWDGSIFSPDKNWPGAV